MIFYIIDTVFTKMAVTKIFYKNRKELSAPYKDWLKQRKHQGGTPERGQRQ